jgi:hypothetical protein
VKEIPLTKGKVAIVDDIDYEWASQWKWIFSTTCLKRGKGYAVRYSHHDGHRETHYLHRDLGKRVGIDVGQFLVDHHDRNELNNVRLNLREATRSQNNTNRVASTKIQSGAKGVYRAEQGRPWQVKLRSNGKNIYVGRFDTLEQAKAAYQKAALHHFGEFACCESTAGCGSSMPV